MVWRRGLIRPAVALLLSGTYFCRCGISQAEQTNGRTGKQLISQGCASSAKRRRVKVEGLSLVCDNVNTSGDDDGYDNQGYTNSLTCLPGDRAKFAIQFDILKMKNYSIDITIDASFYGHSTRIRNHTTLCQFRSLSFTGETDDDLYTPSCPLRKGPYELFSSFTVPHFFKGNEEVPFTPELRIEFHDNSSGLLVGCVESGALGQYSHGKRQSKRGERMFIFCFLGLVVVFATCLIGHRRRRRAGEKEEAKKKASIVRRFHYRRSTRSGTVTPPNINPSISDGSSVGSGYLREVT